MSNDEEDQCPEVDDIELAELRARVREAFDAEADECAERVAKRLEEPMRALIEEQIAASRDAKAAEEGSGRPVPSPPLPDDGPS